MTAPTITEEPNNPLAFPDDTAWRSVSQVKELWDCGERFRLNRLEKVWQRPAAWFPQGTAVHASLEAIERSGRTMTPEQAEQVYLDSYTLEVNALLEETPNFDFWFASGPYAGQQDIERRRGIGLEQISRYYAYMAKHPEETPDTINGTLAVEIPFRVRFGDVPVRGFIDVVRQGKPRDYKSGNKPGDQFQLATYAGALLVEHGIQPTTGDFWMGKTGKATFPIDLSETTEQSLADTYGEADEVIKAGVFEPDPEPTKCRFCTVSASCAFVA